MLVEKITQLIKSYFGRDVLYQDDLQNRSTWLQFLIHARDLIREAGTKLQVLDYLKDKGLFYPVEYDMRTDNLQDRGSFDTLSAYTAHLMQSLPLLGLAVLDERLGRAIYEQAYGVFQKLLAGRDHLSEDEQNVLLLATVQLLKAWQPDGNDDSAFWSFIYGQYGYREHGDTPNQRLYKDFRDIIRESTQRYNRYFAPSQTHRYYTTMMLHAMAPKVSMFNLFEILIRFFGNNLHYQFVENDPSYRLFVERLNSRWGVPSELAKLGLYSADLRSGLRVLSIERPHFMARLCERIVRQMDGMLRSGVPTEKSQEEKPKDYLDILLLEWYQAKSSIKKREWQFYQKQHRHERVVANIQFTNPQYVLNDQRVALFIPNVRLESTSGNYPKLRVFQEDEPIFSEDLDVFGDEFSWTIHKTNIFLDAINIDFEKDLKLRIEVILNGKSIYNSQERLHRKYLVFSRDGQEISASGSIQGGFFLFTTYNSEMCSCGLGEGYQLKHPGVLLELVAEKVQDLRINGEELFISEEARNGFRVYPTLQPLMGLGVLSMGKRYQVFPKIFALDVYVPVDEHALPYVVEINGESWPLQRFVCSAGHTCWIQIHDKTEVCQELRIRHFVSRELVYTLRYIILPGFSIRYHRSIFFSRFAQICGSFSLWEDQYPFDIRLQGETQALIPVEKLGVRLEIMPPVFWCEMQGQEMMEDETAVWHQDIHQDSFITPHVPTGWTCSLSLGQHSVPMIAHAHAYDIGNYIRTHQSDEKIEKLIFQLRDAYGEQQDFLVMPIAFQAQFHSPPLVGEGHALLWYAKNNYMGPRPAVFTVQLKLNQKQIATYNLREEDQILEEDLEHKMGLFTYQVYLNKQSLFTRSEELIASGEFVLGSAGVSRFWNRQILLSAAICWNWEEKKTEEHRIVMQTARIAEVVFVGESIPSGENSVYPEYQGILSFFDNQKAGWQTFGHSKSSSELEVLNPIKFWIINDNLLVMHACTDDGIYFDKLRKHIAYRRPALYMSWEEQLRHLDMPDYFRYQTWEDEHV